MWSQYTSLIIKSIWDNVIWRIANFHTVVLFYVETKIEEDDWRRGKEGGGELLRQTFRPPHILDKINVAKMINYATFYHLTKNNQ